MKERMRDCVGEHPRVYEASGNVFSELLKAAARTVKDLEEKDDINFANISSGMGIDGDDYTVIVYIH